MITSEHTYGDHTYLLTYEGQGEFTLDLLDGPIVDDTGNDWPDEATVSEWAGCALDDCGPISETGQLYEAKYFA